MSSLIDHAEQHRFDGAVVHSLDRWARNPRVQAEALQRLVDADVRFVSVAENMDSGTEFGRVFMKVLASFAEFFSNELSRHSRRSVEGGAPGMKVIESGRTIEGTHAPGALPRDAQQLSFERAGEASVDQTDSPADNKTVPTQLAHSGRQHATRTTPKSRGTAAGYIRVSTEDQTHGFSLDAQRAGVQEYCEKNGYQLVRFYSDEGVSAHTDKISKRPQLSLLLEHAKQEQFDVVVVHTLDRWARNMRVQTEALQRLIDARVGFASVTEDIDFNTAIGRVMMALLAAFAEFFSSQLGEHVKKAVKQRAAQGLQNGSAPFGYLRDDETGIPCPVPEEAEAVRTVFAKRAAGETNGRIAAWLNGQGFETRRARRFTDASIRDILGCRFYLGFVRHGDKEFPGQHEGVIAPELFERVQTRKINPNPPIEA